MKTAYKYKDIKIKDEDFYKQLLSIKSLHGFTSIENMLKGMLKVYIVHRNNLEGGKNGIFQKEKRRK